MPNHRVSWHAHIRACICTCMRYRYMYLSRTCERKSALRRARDRDISTGRGVGRGLISCNRNETNAGEHTKGDTMRNSLPKAVLTEHYCSVTLQIVPRKSRYFPLGIKTRITFARSAAAAKQIALDGIFEWRA